MDCPCVMLEAIELGYRGRSGIERAIEDVVPFRHSESPIE
jgi:hypothetical protein